jgi:hypothetical protein
MRVVFVTRGDTSSTHLYAHFPLMASILPHVRLVSLTKGAEERLCETLQLKRVGVLGLLVIVLYMDLIVGWSSWCRGIVSIGRGEGSQT